MTERERWTVYPLLFLSLAIAMRSKITSSLDLHEITCGTLKSQSVQITGEDGGVRLVLMALPPGAGGGGAVEILSGAGKPEVVLRALPGGGLVELGTERGVPQVVAAVAPAGGVVETLDNRGNVARTLAVGANPFMVRKVGPPPAPPADKPPGEPAEPQSEKPQSDPPPATDEPGATKPPATGDKSAEKPVER